MITEVTLQKGHGKDIIIDIVNVNDIVQVIANDIANYIVIHTGHIENFLQRWKFPAADFVENFQNFLLLILAIQLLILF